MATRGVVASASIFEKKHMGFILMTSQNGCFVNIVDHFGLFNFQKGWKIMILMAIFSLNNHQNAMTPPRVATGLAFPL